MGIKEQVCEKIIWMQAGRRDLGAVYTRIKRLVSA